MSLLQISLIQMETCIASCCLWSVVILKYLLYLCAGFPWLFSNWKHSCSPIFSVWQLLVTLFDKDWHRLNLLTDSRCTSLETQKQIWNWLGKLPHLTTNSTLLAQNSCSLSCHLMVILYTRNAINEILRNCTIRTALTVQWRYQRLYLLQTQNYQWMHI